MYEFHKGKDTEQEFNSIELYGNEGCSNNNCSGNNVGNCTSNNSTSGCGC